jgi:ribonuclease R
MDRELNQELVLAALRERAPRAVHVGELAQRLDAKDRRADIEEMLALLAEDGLVKELPGGRFRVTDKRPPRPAAPPARPARPTRTTLRPGGAPFDADETVGVLSMTGRGFGFVATEGGGGDVFVPHTSLGGALHGDRVRVRTRPSAKGREGEVIAIESRASRRIVGVLERHARALLVVPTDARLRGTYLVEGALPPNAEEGLVVVADVLRYGEGDEATTVRVVQGLGRPGVASVEIAAIKARDGIVEAFPEDVTREADALPAEVPEADKIGREDLRGFDLVTIDPEDARDHDDAVCAERLPDGGFRILVAIADVSHYVREGTAIDREALARGCSIYLPDRAIPMLPHQLSSTLASLLPGVDRLTLAVEVDVSKEGVVRDFRYIEGVMRSGAKLHYGAVARALGLTDQVDKLQAAEDRRDALRVLYDASKVLRARRKRRGSLDFDLPEARVKLDPKSGEPVDVYRSRTDPGVRTAYALIEDMMLLANEVVAADMARRAIPTIYRIHGAPDAKKIGIFRAVASSLGHTLDADAGEHPRKLQRFLAAIEGTPQAQALSYLLLRAMQQAVYDTTNIGHFGLAAPDYLHFTSPIRRYPDLAVHRVIREVIRGRRADPKKWQPKLASWASDSSRLERRAMEAEREAVNVYRAILVRDRLGEEFDATITSVGNQGFYVAFDTPFVESLVPIDSLSGPDGRGDAYEVDDLGIALVGVVSGTRYAMGDRVRVRLTSVNVQRREILSELVLLTTEEGGSRRARLPGRAIGRPGDVVLRPSSRRERPMLGKSLGRAGAAGGTRAKSAGGKSQPAGRPGKSTPQGKGGVAAKGRGGKASGSTKSKKNKGKR